MALQSEISRTPMPKKDADKIQKNFTYLEEHIDAAHLISHIYKDGVIDDEEMLRIGSYPERKSRNKELLTTLLKRGKNAWSSFITALRLNGFTEVANHLYSKEVRMESHNELPGSDESDCNVEVFDSTRGTPTASYLTSYKDMGRDSSLSQISTNKEAVSEKEIVLIHKIESLGAQIENLSKENSELNKVLQEKDDKIMEQKQEIEDLRKKLEPLKEEVKLLHAERVDQNQKTLDLENKVVNLEGKLSDVTNRLRKLEENPLDNKSKLCIVA